MTGSDAQIALVDTPGLHRPRSRLGRRMNTMARDAAREADVLVFVTAIAKNPSEPLSPAGLEVELLEQVDPDSRAVLVINKVDLLKNLKNKAALLPLLDLTPLRQGNLGAARDPRRCLN